MQRVARQVFVMIVAIMVAGCATSGAKFATFYSSMPTLKPDRGRIFIFRANPLGALFQPEVRINGKVVGKAVPGGFFYVDEKPGDYVIETKTEVERTLSLSLASGQERFVRLDVGVGVVAAHIYPELVDGPTGESGIQRCRYIGE